MTTKAPTATTEESLAPKLGDSVHYVHVNGALCVGATVSQKTKHEIYPEDFDTDVAYQRALAKLNVLNMATLFVYNQAREVSSVAHSTTPTQNTFHTSEECPNGQ